LFESDLAASDAHALRLATRQQKTWGSERFQLQIEALAKRELAVRPRARPKATGNVPAPFFPCRFIPRCSMKW
jgi:hypothetical protein